ncbi:MAG TPA: LuxR C-terminal-related transcriptional regulator, partial [Solirubrobacteraceae bacterium]
RDPGDELAGLPDLVVEGRRDDDARALLESVVHARLDDDVEQRTITEAHGNPLALLELPRGLTTAELAGGFSSSVVLPTSGWIEDSFRRRLAKLSADTRELLVVAAAEPVGDPLLVWRAAEWLGIGIEAAKPAEAEGLAVFGARVTFRHPVVRSVVYHSAPFDARRDAHRALAHVTDPQLDPDRRAWHLAQAAPGPPRASDLLLDGLVMQITGGHATAAPMLRRALDAFRGEELTPEAGLRWVVAADVAVTLWDGEAFDALSARFVRVARDAGALSALMLALTPRAILHVIVGEFAMAASPIDEAASVAGACGARTPRNGALALAAFRGREAEASRLIEEASKEFRAAGNGMGLTGVEWTTAVLYNALGHYEDAQAAAQQASDDRDSMRYAVWALVELVEAASRTGHGERGSEALRRLTEITRATGTEWALGIEARSRALLCESEDAERLFREAIERLTRTRLRLDLARAHLVYGEWLRRERRRVEAPEQLRLAHELFVQFGAEGFAERTRVELKATGERVRKRTPDTRDELTSRETQISRLAAEGHTNQQIAAQLFISASTVDYHLRKAFRKLGVKSRTQLARHLLADGAPTARAA